MKSILISRTIASSTLILQILCTVSAKSPAGDRHLKKWPRNPNLDDWSENLSNRRRDLGEEAGSKGGKHLVGVMKMTADEGQKFFPNYWLYDTEDSLLNLKGSLVRSNRDEEINSTSSPMIPALRPLIQPEIPPSFAASQGSEGKIDRLLKKKRNANAVLATLQKRDFQCPTGTADCSAIGHPNSCCPHTDVCFAIEDTGLGPVGCCRRGRKCGGAIRDCSASNTACPSSLGGGCCIPNYVCGGAGCVINPTLVITTVITVTTMISSSEIAIITTTSLPIFSLTSSLETYPTITETETPNDHTCAPGNNCNLPPIAPTSALSSDPGNMPVRPTSLDSSALSKSLDDQKCPTGFYACEAFYVGGCCRTGRNCDTTSCPPRTSTSLVADHVTIQIPVVTETATEKSKGSCAIGWTSCGVNEGGGCCPSGWKCGLTNCLNEKAEATTTVYKENQNFAAREVVKIMNVYINTFFIVVLVIMDFL